MDGMSRWASVPSKEMPINSVGRMNGRMICHAERRKEKKGMACRGRCRNRARDIG
jgi:hypothetical protein